MAKAKRLKILRRNFKFFSVHCAFREPYKVLLDGNFIHAVIEARLGGLTEEIPKLLGAKCKLGVTKCVTSELRSLGASFAGSAVASKKLDHFRCGHVNPVPAAECIQALIGDHNTENFSVATQDANLKEALTKLEGGVPLFYASAFGIQLEPPTDAQKSKFEMMEAADLMVPTHERQVMGLAEGKGKDKARLKKKVKGVNPLACKKSIKKKTSSTSAQPRQEGGCDAAAGGEPKHKRKRQRFKKKGLVSETAAET